MLKCDVIISYYESDRFINMKLENLSSQTIFSDCNFVFINGGKKGYDHEAIEEFCSWHKNTTHICPPKRTTLYEAWNIGIKATKCPYICNTNTDDLLAPDALEKCVAKIEEGFDFVLPDSIYTHKFVEWDEIPEKKHRSIIQGKSLCGSFRMWRRDLHEKYGYFNPRLRVIGDSEWVDKFKDKIKIGKIFEFLNLYYVRSDSLERQRDPITKKRLFNIDQEIMKEENG